MTLNLKEKPKPVSCIKTNAAKIMMNIIKIAEKDIENGRVKKADDVFKELRKKIIQNA
jgi:hypothetical protein